MSPLKGKDPFSFFAKKEHEEISDLEPKKKITDLESILHQYVGKLGFFHLWLYLILCFCQATMAPGVYGALFTDYTPKYYCSKSEDDFKMTIWEDEKERCLVNCTDYSFDKSVFQRTASSEFKIVCDKESLKTVSATLRMSGLLIGSFFFGWFSDIYGRVASITIAGILLFVSQTLNGFSNSYLMFSILNIFMAAGGIGSYLVGFVLMFEWTCPQYRTKVSVFAQVPFAIGFLYCVFLSWCIRSSWRTLQWSMAGPNLLFLIIPFLLPESPRWLVSNGRCEAALASITTAARSQRMTLPENIKIKQVAEIDTKGVGSLIREPVLLFRLFIMSLNWIMITLCFYGLSMNSASKDLFIGLSTMAGVELVGYFTTMLFMDTCGRQPILSICQIIAGLSCVCAGFVPSTFFWPRLCLALIGKAGASAGFAVVFVYTAEMFPTPIRNSAVGLCSTLARIGALCAPFIAGLDSVWEPLPFLIMGGGAVLVGCLSCLLPETRGSVLPETVEEACSLRTKIPVCCFSEKIPIDAI